ncbi:MAG: hypothetical protein JNK82_08540, partial [Myxococcaceae bacterium]|nr:hypothetical protein [Myxococcaceae bacterium]
MRAEHFRVLALVRILVPVGLAASCTVDTTEPDGGRKCDATHACAPGQSCVAGVCVVGGTGGGSATAGGGAMTAGGNEAGG